MNSWKLDFLKYHLQCIKNSVIPRGKSDKIFHYLYIKKYKILLRGIKEDIYCAHIVSYGYESHHFKDVSSPQLIYILNTISVKIPDRLKK